MGSCPSKPGESGTPGPPVPKRSVRDLSPEEQKDFDAWLASKKEKYPPPAPTTPPVIPKPKVPGTIPPPLPLFPEPAPTTAPVVTPEVPQPAPEIPVPPPVPEPVAPPASEVPQPAPAPEPESAPIPVEQIPGGNKTDSILSFIDSVTPNNITWDDVSVVKERIGKIIGVLGGEIGIDIAQKQPADVNLTPGTKFVNVEISSDGKKKWMSKPLPDNINENAVQLKGGAKITKYQFVIYKEPARGGSRKTRQRKRKSKKSRKTRRTK